MVGPAGLSSEIYSGVAVRPSAMGETSPGEEDRSSGGGLDGSVSIEELNTAIRYLVQLAVERDRTRDAGLATRPITPNTESVLKRVVGALLKHRETRLELGLQVKLAGLVPHIEVLMAPWLKGPRDDTEEFASTLVAALHEGDPLVRWDVSLEKVTRALRSLNDRATGKHPRRETACFLGLLCGASDNTMLKHLGVLERNTRADGAVKMQHQAIALRDDMPEHLAAEFLSSNLRWLSCWSLGPQSSRIQAVVEVVVLVHADAILGTRR